MLNQEYYEGVPPRYILFGSEYSWLATSDEEIGRFTRITNCIQLARKLKYSHTIIIDRHDPRFPIFLDPENDYEPFENY